MTCPRLIAVAFGLVLSTLATGVDAAPRHGGPPAQFLTANYRKPGNLSGDRATRSHRSRNELQTGRHRTHS